MVSKIWSIVSENLGEAPRQVPRRQGPRLLKERLERSDETRTVSSADRLRSSAGSGELVGGTAGAMGEDTGGVVAGDHDVAGRFQCGRPPSLGVEVPDAYYSNQAPLSL